MKFHTKDLAIEFESKEEMDTLVPIVVDVVERGVGIHEEVFVSALNQFCAANDLDDRQRLLMMSLVFPTRVLIAALRAGYQIPTREA